ncbi:MAG: hypothetical protein U1F16_09975 [Turneriella sp.]
MRVFIVGAAAVSGRAAMAAAKAMGAEIITTTSRPQIAESGHGNEAQGVEADHTIYGIDLEKPDAVDKMLADKRLREKSVDYVIYIPARGSVGMDVSESKAEMVPPSLEYSVIPYLKLAKALQPKRTIALSGFMALPALMKIYGAMTFTKIAMEELAVRNPDKLQIIRIGMFFSNSVRGIALLAQRRFTREKDFQPDWRAEWKKSGMKFSDFFYDKNYRSEEETYREHANGIPFRPTVPEDITNGFKLALGGENAPIINVLGPWLWTESAMPQLPQAVTSRLNLIPESIYKIL